MKIKEIPVLEDSLYRQYVARFGQTFNPLGLSGEIWGAAEILMQRALLVAGAPVTLESIWKHWRLERPGS